MRLLASILTMVLVSARATTVCANPERRQSAGEHFESGLELANAGGYESALREFNDAYAISPHFAVLYNIGQSHVALGHPLEAIDALLRYLRDGKEQISPERRQQVEAQVALLQSRLAELSVKSDRVGARIIVDGREVGRTPLGEPVRLVAGTHTVSAGVEGGAATSRIVTVGEGEHKELNLELPAPPMTGSSPGPAGVLAVRCDDAALQVSVDGVTVDRASFTRGIAVAAGAHFVRLATPGRPSTEQGIEVRDGASAVVVCAAPPLVDSDGTLSLPRHVRTTPILGYVLGGTGIALGGAALVHYLWNKGRYADWDNTQSELDRQPKAADHRVRQMANNDLADSIERASKVSVGLAVVGEALFTSGIVLVLWGPGGAMAMPAPSSTAPQRWNVGVGVAPYGLSLNGSF